MIRNPVTLAPLAEATFPPVQSLRGNPFHVDFSGDHEQFMQGPETGFDPHVILKEDTVVGMFRVQTTFHLSHTFASSDTPGIRNFIIADDQQGKGMGTEACRLLPDYLRGVLPRARGAYMTVNFRNEGGYRAFTRGGWTDTGTEYTLGVTGPQHVLWMPLR